MSTSALARLKRAITELDATVSAPGTPARPADTVRIKSEIEACIQKLDELRQKL